MVKVVYFRAGYHYMSMQAACEATYKATCDGEIGPFEAAYECTVEVWSYLPAGC